MNSVSLEMAKRLILKKQMLSQPVINGSKQVVEVVRKLCGVQYDPLPVVEQAHYLALWNRIKNFRKDSLDEALYRDRSLIEFVLMRQTLNIVPAEELPYYYQAVQCVFRRGWIQRAIDSLSPQDARKMVERIKSQGMISLKDFSYPNLRALFYAGKTAIARRESGIFRMPYYGLLGRLHPDLTLRSGDEEDARKWLVERTVSAFGMSSTSHVAYWTGYRVDETEGILGQLEMEKAVRKVKVDGLKGLQWVTDEDFAEIEELEAEKNVALLSPIDNLTRDRKWLGNVFGYSFSIEYFQKKKMRWQISILCSTNFLGFIDAKMDRRSRMFMIKELFVHREGEKEDWLNVARRIVDFAVFHKATGITLGERCPKWFLGLFGKLGCEYKSNLVIVA
jgi:uncharacterized protein YcaQ